MSKDSTSPPGLTAAARVAPLIDIGINLAHDSYDSDRDAVLRRAWAAGLVQMIVTGSDGASTRRAIELAQAHPNRLFATAGVHPHHASDLTDGLLQEIEDLARVAQVVAVGECGLDYFRNLSPPKAQRAAFQRQLELAGRLGKPVFLHERDAHEDFVAIVREHRGQLVGGVAHCFTGTRQELARYVELDLFIGVTGWICDERRGSHLVQAVRDIPGKRLLLETDGPYLLPRNLAPRPSSRRNEPAYLPLIAATVAAARGETVQAVARASTAAARALFGLPDI